MIAVLKDLVGFAPRWHYIGVLAMCVVGTLPLEFIFRARVYARWRRAVLAIALGSAPFVLWDYLAVRAGNWEYSPDHTLGIMIGIFPLEELLFFVVIPLCALLTYQAVGTILARRRSGSVDAGELAAGIGEEGVGEASIGEEGDSH